MLINNNSKFLFYSFKDYLNGRGLPVQYVTNKIKSDNTHGLLVLQENDWSYFIERLLELCEKDSIDLESLGSEVDI